MATHYIIAAGLVGLLGVAAYATNGFESSESKSLLRKGDAVSSDLARSLDHNSIPTLGSVDNLLDSSTKSAQRYGESVAKGIDKEVSDMSSYVEEQMKLLAQTVQKPNRVKNGIARGSSKLRRVSSPK